MRTISNPDKAGRHRALRLYPDLQPCEVCGKTGTGRGSVDRHHRDSDRMNNSRENIAFLCRLHHHAAHRLTDGKIGGGPRPRMARLQHDRGGERAATARALRAEGWGIEQIAAMIHVHPKSVQRYLYDRSYE